MKDGVNIKNYLPFLVSILCAFFSMLVFPGYKVNFEDQNYYTPAFLQKIDPTLFHKDFLLFSSQTKYSFFDEFIAFFVKDTASLYKAYFVLYFLGLVMFFLGIYLITKKLTKDFHYALFMPAIFVAIFSGAVINSLPPLEWHFSYSWTLHPRFLVTALLTFSFGLFLNKKDFWAWVFGTVGILFHSLTAVLFLIFWGIFTLFEKIWKKKNWKYGFYYLIPCAGLLFFLFSKGETSESFGFFSVLTPEWKEILLRHTDYLFFSRWFTPKVVLSVLMPLLVFYGLVLEADFLSEKSKKLLTYLWGVLIFFLIIYALFFEIFNIAFFLQIQFLRFFIWLKILLFISIVFVFLKALIYEKHKRRQLVLLFALLGVLMLHHYFFVFWVLSFFIFRNKQQKNIFKNRVQIFLFLIITLTYYWHLKILDLVPLTVWETLDISTIALLILEKFFISMERLLPIVLLIGGYGFCKQYVSKINYVYVTIFLGIGVVFGGYFFHTELEKTSNPLACELSESECALNQWISKNIKKDELILLSEKYKESSFFLDELGMFFSGGENFSREFYFYLRNQLHKNVFVTYWDRGQGTFNREYAQEWQKRLKIANNPEKYISELETNYEVDYIIASEKLDLAWERVYEDGRYFVYRRKNY